MCQQAQFVVDIVSRLPPATQDQPFASRLDKPVLVEPAAQRSDHADSEAL